MEWLESEHLPAECVTCQEEDCYNCDFAGKRWYLSEEEEQWIKGKALERATERLMKQMHN